MVRLIKFCLIGLVGMGIDMGLLFLFRHFGLFQASVICAKLVAAEIALINNFIWNDIWTFRDNRTGGLFARFLRFNLFCGGGLILGTSILWFEVNHFGWNVYVANFIAICITTSWNFAMNRRFNWPDRH